MPVVVGQIERIELPAYRVGSNSSSPITVTPYSRYDLPAGLGGNASGAVTTMIAERHRRSARPDPDADVESIGDGTSTVTAHASATLERRRLEHPLRHRARRRPLRHLRRRGDRGLHRARRRRGVPLHGSARSPGSATQSFGRSPRRRVVRAVQAGRAPTGWTFAVDAVRRDVAAGRAEWLVRDASDVERAHAEQQPRRVRRLGAPPTVFDRDPGIQVRYVHDGWGTATPWAAVRPAAGSAPVPGAGALVGADLRRRVRPRHAGRLVEGPSGGRRRSRSATPGCLLRRAGAVLPTPQARGRFRSAPSASTGSR